MTWDTKVIRHEQVLKLSSQGFPSVCAWPLSPHHVMGAINRTVRAATEEAGRRNFLWIREPLILTDRKCVETYEHPIRLRSGEVKLAQSERWADIGVILDRLESVPDTIALGVLHSGWLEMDVDGFLVASYGWKYDEQTVDGTWRIDEHGTATAWWYLSVLPIVIAMSRDKLLAAAEEGE